MKKEMKLKLHEIFKKDYNDEDVIESTLELAEKIFGIEDSSINYAIVGQEAFDGVFPSVYLKERRAIVFNNNWIKASNKEELIFHTLYTARYAYQHLAILGLVDENQSNVKNWRDNFNNYERPTGNEEMDSDLMTKDIEIDARSFATLVMKRYYETEYDIPKAVKEEVEKYMDVLDNKYFHNNRLN